jgi:hypothetical protein
MGGIVSLFFAFIILLTQIDTSDIDQLELERHRADLNSNRPDSAMFTILASYEDGTPMHKGQIQCDGDWWIFMDEGEERPGGFWYWFPTDSRGGQTFITHDMQPHQITCRAKKHGKSGSVTFMTPSTRSTERIVIR